MKRTPQDYAGRPLSETTRPDVMGGPCPVALAEVASFLDARGEDTHSDASVVREFSEFLSGIEDPEAPIFAEPDPAFRERLRRRIWRLHLLAQPMRSNDHH